MRSARFIAPALIMIMRMDGCLRRNSRRHESFICGVLKPDDLNQSAENWLCGGVWTLDGSTTRRSLVVECVRFSQLMRSALAVSVAVAEHASLFACAYFLWFRLLYILLSMCLIRRYSLNGTFHRLYFLEYYQLHSNEKQFINPVKQHVLASKL